MRKTTQVPHRYACQCGHLLDLVSVLDQKAADRIGRSGMLSAHCGQCGEVIEIRLKHGGFDVGYSYFGGSMHFEPMCAVRVPGMTVAAGDPDDIEVTIGDRNWHFGIRQPCRQRLVVFPQAFVAGRPVGRIDFAHLSVRLTGIERDRVRLEWNQDTVICANDFLHLEGMTPAITRAWHYMNDGTT